MQSNPGMQLSQESKQLLDVSTLPDSHSQNSLQPQWMTDELQALKKLKHSFKDKYKRKLPEIESCTSTTIAQIMTDEFYLRFITETLEAAGETRGNKILSKLKVTHDLKWVKHRVQQLQENLDLSAKQAKKRTISSFRETSSIIAGSE